MFDGSAAQHKVVDEEVTDEKAKQTIEINEISKLVEHAVTVTE